ncbi:MAG: hypothetical protein IT581_12275 [Verrucomicrobiales bacterium]|nr:hypothetical protein [Verrucomicrobiales bacterium]
MTRCDAAALESAMAGGGLVTLRCSGTIALSRTLQVTQDTVLDASGQSVVLDGADAVQLFSVTGGAKLTLVNLTLSRGVALPRSAADTDVEATASGGAVFLRSTITNASFVSSEWVSNVCHGGLAILGSADAVGGDGDSIPGHNFTTAVAAMEVPSLPIAPWKF